MINISDFKQLGIILPNTNKALAKVLTEATHKELEAITQGKYLKTVLSSLLKQSASSPESNKDLLQLVKDNPTLKNLGDVSTTIKDLLNTLKSDKNPLPLEKVLQSFLSEVKDLKNTQLKQKLENSGVFLESKLKEVNNPQLELKNTLISLVKKLQLSNDPSSRLLANEAKILLKTEVLQAVKTPNVAYGEVKLKEQHIPSPRNNTQVITNLESITSAKDTPKGLQELSKNVEKLLTDLKTTLSKTDTIHHPSVAKALEQLGHKLEPKLLTSENFKLAPIKESLEQVSLYLNKSFTMESKSILNSLEKIFQVLKNVEQAASNPSNSLPTKTTLDSFLENKMPRMISNLTQEIKEVIQKSEPIFHKDTKEIVQKLETLNTSTKLHPQNNIREISTNDLKAILLHAGDEIAKSNHPNQGEITKQIDKLSLQIDNFQLLSHLSNGTSLYLPFAWDMMEEGNIEMKKSDDDKFYCDIYLKLKDFGEVNLKLTLYDKNQLNIHIYSSNEEFKSLIQENVPMLRSALIDSQITPREIRIHETQTSNTPTSPYQQADDNIYMGFEVKA